MYIRLTDKFSEHFSGIRDFPDFGFWVFWDVWVGNLGSGLVSMALSWSWHAFWQSFSPKCSFRDHFESICIVWKDVWTILHAFLKPFPTIPAKIGRNLVFRPDRKDARWKIMRNHGGLTPRCPFCVPVIAGKHFRYHGICRTFWAIDTLLRG